MAQRLKERNCLDHIYNDRLDAQEQLRETLDVRRSSYEGLPLSKHWSISNVLGLFEIVNSQQTVISKQFVYRELFFRYLDALAHSNMDKVHSLQRVVGTSAMKLACSKARLESICTGCNTSQPRAPIYYLVDSPRMGKYDIFERDSKGTRKAMDGKTL